MIFYFEKLKSRLSYNPLTVNSKKKGIALILAMMSLMFMVYIATEVTRDSSIEYIVNSQELNRIKAYYAARNGLQIALLRIKVYQQASQNPLPENYKEIVDRIGWKDPFFWPLPIPSDLNSVDTEIYSKINSESLLDASFTHTIEDEGSKIDLNDLASPSKTLKAVTQKQLLSIFEQKITTDEDFRNEYQNTNFEELVGHIHDWMSDSTTALNGGDKRAAFTELGPSYPPNRGFRTIEELRLVPGMTDVFYNLLSPRVTIYGMKAINPNTASKEVLLSLDPGMTDEAITEALERRSNPDKGGPFKGENEKCLEDFKNFVESRGARLSKEFEQIPMVCNKVFNFRIKSTGIFGSGKFSQQKNITAVIFDLNKSSAQVKTFLDKEKQADGASPASGDATTTTRPTGQEPLPKGPPRIVYWTEN